jgi:deoxyribose-phosphate aldolase
MNIAEVIDSTLLKPEATRADIEKLCAEASSYGFASVCVNSACTDLVSRLLAGTTVKTCTVIGFPLGAAATPAKVSEASWALESGAVELDMVMNIGALKSGEPQVVRDDIRAVANICEGRALVKVILECALLTDPEKVEACEISIAAGADFVKTSTGFGPGGATVDDVRLLKETAAGRALVKASGGIRDLDAALSMLDAGADRLGTSNGAVIVDEARRRGL